MKKESFEKHFEPSFVLQRPQICLCAVRAQICCAIHRLSASSLDSVVIIKGMHAKDVVLLKGEGLYKKLSLFCAS